jgi:NAD(P)-dependent dehydrogenase (short-subunit alcohol dehydrogenase family)
MADAPNNAQATGLSGRVAIVTGAANGLGRSEAIGLARSGAMSVNLIGGRNQSRSSSMASLGCATSVLTRCRTYCLGSPLLIA